MAKIIYTCPYVPGEWIAAHGLAPVRVMPRHLSDHEGLGRVEGLCALEGRIIADYIGETLGMSVLEIEVPSVSDSMGASLGMRMEALVETVLHRRKT